MFNTLLLKKTIRDLKWSLAQTIALVIIIALGIASYVALIGAYRDLSVSYAHTYNKLNFADVTFSLKSFPQSKINKISHIKGVGSVSGRLIIDTGIEFKISKSKKKITRTRLIGIPQNHQPSVNKVYIEKGRYFIQGNSQSALVESHFAEIYNIKPGDTLYPFINGRKTHYKVAGLIASPEYLIVSPSRQEVLPSASTFAVLFVSLPRLQKLTNSPNTINDIDVNFKPGVNQNKVISEIKKQLNQYGILATTLKKDQPSNAALKLDIDGYHEIAFAMPALILFVAIASIYMLLSRQVRAQQSQIGIIKSLGYNNRSIIAQYMVFALIIGIIGSIVGVLAGFPLSGFITSSYAKELGIPFVKSLFHFDTVIVSVVISLVAAAIAGIGPAYSATKVAPAIAMHPNVTLSTAKGKVTFLERFIHLPLWTRLSLRSLFRVRRRTLTTAIGIVFAFILVLVSWGVIDSMSYMVNHNFDVVERWDVATTFSNFIPNSALKKIDRLKGVKQTQAFIELPANLKANNEKADVIINSLPDQRMHKIEIYSGKSAKESLASGEIIINIAIANKLKVKPGDKILVDTPFGKKKLVVGSTTQELSSPIAYLSLKRINKWNKLSKNLFNALYLKIHPSQADKITSKLWRQPGVTSVQLKSGTKNDWQSLLGLFYAFMGFIMAFGVAMAFALIFNTTTINILERQREFATMRAIGTRISTISYLVTLEDIILWLIALIPGLLVGYWAALQMGNAFQSDLFYFKAVIYPSSYIITSLGVLATILLATIPAIRRINKLNLASETKMLSS
jgi:putative ABC transport system permease protein